MKCYLALLIVLPAVALAAGRAAAQVCQPAEAQSWIFLPSSYSHDATSGARVNQFQPEKPAYARVDPTYLESGYRHYHTVLRSADGGYDHTHLVQTWGLGERIRPYGEWEFPYRAGATPFGPWGNPQGPWTLPFDSWVNPYGLGQLPNPPWPYGQNYGPNYGANYGPSGSPYQAPPGTTPYGPSPDGAPHQSPAGPPSLSPYGGPYQPPSAPYSPSPHGGMPTPPPAPHP